MRFGKKAVIGIVGIFLIAGLVIGYFLISNSETGVFAGEKKRKSRFYRGLPTTEIYSKSDVSLPHDAYIFAPVLQFDLVLHDFIVKNDSTELLQLRNVKGCCGCVVVSYSSQIQPGMTGKISTMMITDRYGGRTIAGTIKGETSLSKDPDLKIDISLFVKNFASISNPKIMLEGGVDQDVQGKSTIVPDPDYPFHILGVKAKKGIDIKYSYTRIEKSDQGGYIITVKNIRTRKGVYRDKLFIQTDHPKRPEFFIRVQGNIL